MLSSEMTPTRSAMLQLRDEQDIILEAYDFLDEKRLLLAAELLSQLDRYQKRLEEFEQLRVRAETALVRAIRRHGLHGIQVYPGDYLENADISMSRTTYMGVMLVTSALVLPEDLKTRVVCYETVEAEQCRQVFVSILRLGADLAGISGNLHRLMAEYRRTERRARALENVVIPEIGRSLKEMSSHIEELDQEDIVRVHLKHK